MKRVYLAIIVTISVGISYAQRGYWFESHFIGLEKEDTTSFYVQSLSANGILESSLAQLINIDSKDEFVKLYTGRYIIKCMKRPQIKGLYLSDIYNTNESEWIIIKPKVSLCLKEGFNLTSIIKKYEGILSEANHRKGVYRLNCNVLKSDDVLDLVAKLSQEEGVEWCEPVKLSSWKNYNSKYNQQYYLKNTVQNGGTSGIDINVEPAWSITTGNPNITVAVIDHED